MTRNCFSKIVFSLSRVDSARFSLRLLLMNRDTAFLTGLICFWRNSHCFAVTVLLSLVLLFQLPFELLSLFPTAGFRATADEWTVRSEDTIDPLWAAAALVVDVVGRAGRIVAGVDREHEFGPFAESIVRLLYDFFYVFYNYLIINSL